MIPPFHLWYMDTETHAPQGGVIGKDVAQARIPGLVAAEIVRLLNLGESRWPSSAIRPLKASDIAVLVRQNREALLVQKALWPNEPSRASFSARRTFSIPTKRWRWKDFF
jgi:ATP-dependent exoDNAse (exonuclease V) beta subunit